MSKIGTLALEIFDMLEAGKSCSDIAQELEIPVNWVYEVMETLDTLFEKNDETIRKRWSNIGCSVN